MRFRNVLCRGASLAGGAFAPEAGPFLAATGAWFRATDVFFVVLDAVGFLAPVAVAGGVGFTTVVPTDAVDELVLVLSLRSFCRVADRGAGDWTALPPVLPARLVVPLRCEGGLLSLVPDAAPFAGRARGLSAELAGAPLSGLEAFSGEPGGESGFCSLSGELRRGECGYVLEFRDLGERILESAPVTFWGATREGLPAGPLARRLGLFRLSACSLAGAFSLSEYTPS